MISGMVGSGDETMANTLAGKSMGEAVIPRRRAMHTKMYTSEIGIVSLCVVRNQWGSRVLKVLNREPMTLRSVCNLQTDVSSLTLCSSESMFPKEITD